jgi:hypothetical protein
VLAENAHLMVVVKPTQPYLLRLFVVQGMHRGALRPVAGARPTRDSRDACADRGLEFPQVIGSGSTATAPASREGGSRADPLVDQRHDLPSGISGRCATDQHLAGLGGPSGCGMQSTSSAAMDGTRAQQATRRRDVR